eukprot:1348636-Prymnesium_polylepis.1
MSHACINYCQFRKNLPTKVGWVAETDMTLRRRAGRGVDGRVCAVAAHAESIVESCSKDQAAGRLAAHQAPGTQAPALLFAGVPRGAARGGGAT